MSDALERSGNNGAISHLDEKVKECGRLIVRMGTEVRTSTHSHARPMRTALRDLPTHAYTHTRHRHTASTLRVRR